MPVTTAWNMANRAPQGGTRLTMAISIRAALARHATLRVALAVLAGVLACVGGLARRGDRLGGLELLDGRGSYTPAEAAALPPATVRRLKRRDSHTLPPVSSLPSASRRKRRRSQASRRHHTFPTFGFWV